MKDPMDLDGCPSGALRRWGAGMLALGVIWPLAGSDLYAQGAPQALEPRSIEEREDERAWSNNAELSWVVATGNATANTLGFRNLYQHQWDGATLSWEAGWVRAESTDGDRVAEGLPGGDYVIVDPPTKLDSQRLYSKLGFRQAIVDPHYWFANYDGVRDEPSNINRQFVWAGGLGTQWVNRENLQFRTQYGISVTNEDLDLEGADTFGGYRLYYALKAGIAGSATVDSELTFDGSFKQSDDVRTDWLNGVNVALNSNLALRSSLRVLVRNVPALEEIDLVTPILGVVVGTVEVPKGKVDTNFTTSLVFTF